MSWTSSFGYPIVLPDGKKLASPHAIAHLVETVPAAERQMALC
jgi:hypothetical protein